MKRVRLSVVTLTLLFLITACDAGSAALIHFSGKVYYSMGDNQGVLGKQHKDALNGVLTQVETAILSDTAGGLEGTSLASFYNERRDIVVSFNRSGEQYYIYYADILDGSEHSKRYYAVPPDTAAEIIEIIDRI